MTHWAPWTDNTSYVGEKTPSHKKTQKIFVTPGCLSLSGHFESVWGNCLSLWSGFVSLSRIFCSRRIGGPWSSWVLTSAYICVQQRMYYKDNADCIRSFFLLRKGQNHLFYIFTSDKQTYNLSHKSSSLLWKSINSACITASAWPPVSVSLRLHIGLWQWQEENDKLF